MLQNQEDKRNHTLYVHFGNSEYFSFYKKEYKNTVDNKTYRAVVKELNTTIRDKIAGECYDFKLPKRLGVVAIRKHKKKIAMREGKPPGFNLAPDWKATRKLWEVDPEAKKNRKTVKHENSHSGGYTYMIRYFKRTANYKNKSVYRFKPSRTLARLLSFNIKNNKLDAFIV